MSAWLKASLWLLIWLGHSAMATQIIPESQHSDDIKLLAGTEGMDVVNLTIRPTNEAGISVNRFSRFRVNNQPLRILNLPDFSGSTPAKLIVIHSADIVLSNHIELVGEAADILFFTDKSGATISCGNCSFSHVLRVSFAAGTLSQPLQDSTSAVGNINLTGKIDINQMSAPGALSVNTLSRYLTLDGSIDTHQRAKKTSQGEYVSDATGRYRIGGGAVNIHLGEYTVNYDTQKISNIPAQSSPPSSTSLKGTIHSTAVTLTMANSGYRVQTMIDTSSNLVFSTSYRGTPVINEESILLQSFNAPLTVNAQLSSDNKVTLQSNDSLTLGSNSVVSTNTLALIAKNQIINNATLLTTNVEIAANDLFNKGQIEGLASVDIAVVNNLLNAFGGNIQGKFITLESEHGLIRNGSRTPFLSEYNQYNNLLNWDINNISAAELGTFYALRLDANESLGKRKAKSLAATILSDKLRVRAKAFENINPYYVYKGSDADWSEGVPLDAALANQVLVSAEKELFIRADNYVVNSSAVMRLNQQGSIYIDTGLLTNERYRSQIVIDRKSEKWEENFVYYSPPGLIHAIGDFNLKAESGFINNTAFFEVFGNVTLDTPKLKELGVAISQISYETYTTVYKTCLQKSNGGYCTEPGEPKNVEHTIVHVNQDEKESLFFVEGDFIGPKTTVNTAKHDPVAYYQNLALAKYKQQEYYIPYAGQTKPIFFGTHYSFYTDVGKDMVKIRRTTCGRNPNDRVDNLCTITTVKTASIVDIILDYIAEIKAAVQDFFEKEVDWWN